MGRLKVLAKTFVDWNAQRFSPTYMALQYLYQNWPVVLLAFAAVSLVYKKWTKKFRLRIERKVDKE